MQIRKSRRLAENRRFLADLARTGNARLTAARLGVHRGTYLKRRARDPAFAAAWAHALAHADAMLGSAESTTLSATPTQPSRRQLRAANRPHIGRAQEEAFLAALDATNNIRTAAAATGFAHSSILARARRSPRFARELATRRRIAADCLLARGLLEAADGSYLTDEALIQADEARIPWMDAAIQLAHHDENGRLRRHYDRLRLRHHETDLASARASILALCREAHWRETGNWRFEGE